MDKYVIREARVGTNYPQGNQMMAFPTNVGRANIQSPETTYYGVYTNQFTNLPHVSNSSYVDSAGNVNTAIFGQNMHQVAPQMVTGIDPRYLANYSDNSAQYIMTELVQWLDKEKLSEPSAYLPADQVQPTLITTTTMILLIWKSRANDRHTHFGQPSQRDTGHFMSNDPNFGCNYQNRSFTGIEKNKPNTFTQTVNNAPRPITTQNVIYDDRRNVAFQHKQEEGREQIQQSLVKGTSTVSRPMTIQNVIYDDRQNLQPMREEGRGRIQQSSLQGAAKVMEPKKVPKKENQNHIMSRAERLQALHKSGPRAFSGPVEKVLKWHKALQDIGIFVFYEIVAKCVNVRPGESFSKNLVIRDDNGPAMQVVYYEIDFLLPELKVPSTVRVIGRMMPGTCRLQAFNVRPATGDDVATLPRRAAVGAHHVARLCKEYGVNA